jgi:hypothetical protein
LTRRFRSPVRHLSSVSRGGSEEPRFLIYKEPNIGAVNRRPPLSRRPTTAAVASYPASAWMSLVAP